jgi:D-glycero-beta-D-manno-heptose-7-phosphate kinase
MKSAQQILDSLRGSRVLVVGDVMLDRYLTGAVTRISPEAPVPVVLQRNTEDRLGGAANVALNLHALGAEPVLCSVVGTDHDGQVLIDALPEEGLTDAGILRSTERRTTVKTRILGNNQQMLRIDQEDTHDLSAGEAGLLVGKIRDLLDASPVQVIIFQDYNKGVLSPEVIRLVLAEARQRGILTAVDPKKNNFFAFKGVDLFKPNLKEIRDSSPFPVDTSVASLKQSARFLQEQLQNRLTMITLSEKGLYLNDGDQGTIYPTIARNVADVSGAGDTVISIAALALAANLPLEWVAILSNLAGGQVCEFPGVVPVRRDLLASEIDEWMQRQPA